ncbi:hypothetical protein ACOSQ2_025662 [Xanthoceras sorbifolium]
MYCNIDLRYGLPLLLNLTSFLLLTPTTPSAFWDQQDFGFSKIFQYPLLMIPLFVVAFIILLLLVTSFELPLNIEPLRLRVGHFSGYFAVLLCVSIIFSPPVFCLVYIILMIMSPWHQLFFELFKCIFRGFHHMLQSMPTLVIICISQRGENTRLSQHEEDDANMNGLELNDGSRNEAREVNHGPNLV